MPGRDRTGPRGEGPMTGRGAGYCAGFSTAGYPDAGYPDAGYPAPGYWGFGPRFGFGRGGGWGRGWRHRAYAPRWPRRRGFPAYAPPTREQEADMLASQAEWLQAQLDEINERLADLEPAE
jgi:hypothetical protein